MTAHVAALQDMTELRFNRWVERRVVEGPKTIGQIHRDAAQEQLRQKAMADPRGGGGRDRRDFSRPNNPPPPMYAPSSSLLWVAV